MRRFPFWLILTFCLALAVGLTAYPLAVIQPFRSQSPNALQRALFIFRTGPAVSSALALIAIVATALAWRSLRFRSRLVAGTLLLLTGLAAILGRINVFELMFHPNAAPRFLSAKDARIEADDLMIVVALNGDSKAYPIREMAYHHVINDSAGGVPIVANY